MSDTPTSEVLATVARLSELALGTYAYNPGRVEEDANGERRIHQGGYGDRQVFELVQNAADELRGPEHSGGRIQVVLTDTALYCANEGAPITADGADTILRMGVSKKRSGQIGRFGVGIKSVLSISTAPQFFSTSGSFGFDAQWSRVEIDRAVRDGQQKRGEPTVGIAGDTPVLRLARPLDWARECAADAVLSDLSKWAATVVRLPLRENTADALAGDIDRSATPSSSNREFPHLFLLFSPHVGHVVLEDRRLMPVLRRTMRSEVRADGEVVIHQTRTGDRAFEEAHRVFVRAHEVSDRVRAQAGELHDRATIDVSWAVPCYLIDKSTGRDIYTVPVGRGTFWSYFPTKYPTTLSGVVNAAWKTNEDRQNLLDSSELNRELLSVTAELVVASLVALSPADDPAAYLQLLPGRTQESPNWACKELTGAVWKLMVDSPSLPDQNGTLRRPSELRIRPEGLPYSALEMWSKCEDAPVDWLHPSVDSTKLRRGKLSHVLDAGPNRQSETVTTWLEALVTSRSAESSRAALGLLAHLLTSGALDDKQKAAALQARIVMVEGGAFVSATPGQVYRRSSNDGLIDDLVYVHGLLFSDRATAQLLESLGIREADAEGRFKGVLDQGFEDYTPESWQRFWELLRSSGGAAQTSLIQRTVPQYASTLRLRTVRGLWVTLENAFLPGPVVPADGSRDSGTAVDTTFHSDDLSVLRALGVSDRPDKSSKPLHDKWFIEYQTAMYEDYCAALSRTDRRVNFGTLKYDGAPMAGKLDLFVRLSAEGRARFLETLSVDDVPRSWTRQVGNQTSTRVHIPSPVCWLIRDRGTVRTSQGVKAVAEVVGPQLSEFADYLPVAQISSPLAVRLEIPGAIADVPAAMWADLLRALERSEDDAFVGRTYALLIRVAPDIVNAAVSVRCRVGGVWEMRPDNEVAVARTRGDYDELVREKHPALLVDRPEDQTQADYMVAEWGMYEKADVIARELRHVPVGPSVDVLSAHPSLRARFAGHVSGYELQRCQQIEEVFRTPNGTSAEALHSACDGSTILVPEGLDALAELMVVDYELGLDLGRSGCERVISEHHRQMADREVRGRIDSVRQADSITTKLARLVGRTELLRGLPPGLNDQGVEALDDVSAERAAEMAYNSYDDRVLREYLAVIRSVIPDAPQRLDGSHAALRFVTRMGFPDTFGGTRVKAPPARIAVAGPTDYPALHSYQEAIAERFVNLLQERPAGRAMLSLPTGAGKTRVAAEGVIRWVRQNGAPRGPIVWIAQTAELCEQAVQSWKFVWEKVGADEDLVIDRLWSSNSATPTAGRNQLVVATDAKLASCLDAEEYEWLRAASLVIVDEAHVAISKEYTRILDLFGLTHRTTSRPLIGLTATPFRNDTELTRRLVQRFGDRRLDKGLLGDDPIEALQDMGVLSRVEHRQMKGTRMSLHPDELRQAEQMNGMLPRSAEQRLARDEARNSDLLNEIAALDPSWPVLVFATSVDHAKVLAARLNERRIRSVAIDSGTSAADRRQSIEKFRRGDVRVITNYGVLSQGFDAPATRVVIVARPVYSANIYQQMVGRGLRGIRNGGKDTCLILDVADNITNFDQKLAFTKFEHLWG
ncbi:MULTISPECIES: DEAD/DEAH box helicase [Nocardiaceae]|uniref:DEAD/DEAH box helicase n=1 Tax=Rhodococcoides kroppenstedtii TaxID=293050 RepID=A0ABS7NPQ5_9NOCA|nr:MULTISPECIES: DEAD/DEAH box helicase [Rhodococcus]AMY18054.1 ATP-dependent RNA helicase SrmB [Rhodococcus sp. PBTS 1]MBY6313610.1 DEAD/DEAH box helicase [Rhodococcus kroppenstedtii]MBY6319967.1 DEAD/DEAH box helicase [Rhodococcus kroppenstedtii]MBY6398906.1 DEAD/DEAH box helicase [Rhodococcus kroppenstedtii]